MTSKIIVNNIEADAGISSVKVLSPVVFSGVEGQVDINGSVSITGVTTVSSNLNVTGATTFSGHVLPNANDSYDLGSSSQRWRNVYTNDLNLSNEGNSNDVDGTWGDWTLQEGETDVFMINNRSGKKYRIKLEEVE